MVDDTPTMFTVVEKLNQEFDVAQNTIIELENKIKKLEKQNHELSKAWWVESRAYWPAKMGGAGGVNSNLTSCLQYAKCMGEMLDREAPHGVFEFYYQRWGSTGKMHPNAVYFEDLWYGPDAEIY